ncbi:MAG TPA: hypothetical protein VGJ87_20990 [Roseiflexaceae bacterium]|jgi:hypothetical protein
MRALAKDPAERFPKGADFAAAMRALPDDQTTPITAPRTVALQSHGQTAALLAVDQVAGQGRATRVISQEQPVRPSRHWLPIVLAALVGLSTLLTKSGSVFVTLAQGISGLGQYG